MQIEKPVLGQITQGTIFTAALAEHYPDSPTWGMCITARCDVAHANKTTVLNYVPIIPYEDWLQEDGARLLTDRIQAELLGNAKGYLDRKQKSSTVLDSYDPVEVAKMLFQAGDPFFEIARKLSLVRKHSAELPISREAFCEISSLNKKISERLIKELWSNQLTGFYFLPCIGETEHSSKCGYVVLLREIHHIPRKIAAGVANGAAIEESAVGEFYEAGRRYSKFDFSYPTGKLRSPWIEHLMQQFSMLFGRIGLPDGDLESLETLYKAMSNV